MSGAVITKGLLRFGFELPEKPVSQGNFDFFIGEGILKLEPEFLFSAFYNGEEICRCIYTLHGEELRPKIFFNSAYAPDAFIAVSIAKILILESEQSGRAASLMIVSQGNHVFESALRTLGFIESSDDVFVMTLDRKKGELIRTTKNAVLRKLSSAEKVGRGYALSTDDIDSPGLQSLSHEYNEIAWGLTSWARNSAIDLDETGIIERYAKNKVVAEVGAGSGRVSSLISSLATSATLTDYTQESCNVLTSKFKNSEAVKVVQDDITETRLPAAKFDVVFFLENGLGNLLSLEARKKAVIQMCSLVAPKGRLVIGLRSLEQSPCAHVMVATQNEHILGIYHIFSKEELYPLLPSDFTVEEITPGNPRPAGGEAFFMSIMRNA